MKRRGTSVLLIPLLAAMALFYPVATRRPSVTPAQVLTSQQKESAAEKERTTPEEWQGGRLAVQRFFRTPGSKWQSDPRENATIKFLIATVPDPVDSGLPHVYDRYMAAIQSAVQTQPYFLSKFSLPWEDCLVKGKDKDKDNPDGSDDETKTSSEGCKRRRYRREPGFFLLTNQKGKGPGKGPGEQEADKSKIDLLLIYFVGETPTAGIHKRALFAALNEISWFCRWRESHAPASDEAIRRMATECAHEKKVRILGPSYSGSAQSLDLALSGWLDSIPNQMPFLTLKMLSGSATAIENPEIRTPEDLQKSDFYQVRSRLGPRFVFHSMEVPDSVAESEFCKYLKDNAGTDSPIRVAILSESGTAYGRREIPAAKAAETQNTEAEEKEPECEVGIEKTLLPYPAHISQLRAVSEKLRQSQNETTVQPQISEKSLPLAESLEDAGSRRDVQTFSPATAVIAEQVMANLLSTISREHYKYVGILATDTRDTMFLAQEVREHSPSTVLFTYGADLLFLHPEINQTLRGMLIVTSYPVNDSVQIWSVPSHPQSRLQFPDDGSEGVYNATLALLCDDEHMVEFSLPLSNKASDEVRPPVWMMVVGRNRLWPVIAHDVASDPRLRNYTYGLSAERAGTIDRTYLWRGLYSEATLIFATAFSILCIAFGLPLLTRLQQGKGRPGPFEITEQRKSGGSALGRRGNWWDRLLGETVSDTHRRAGELCLLAACASLGTFLTVLVTTLYIPAGAMRAYGAQGRLSWGPITAIVTSCVAEMVLVISGIALLLTLFRPAVTRSPQDREKLNAKAWTPIAAGCLAAFGLAWALSGSWIYNFWNGDRLAVLFASLRSLELLSGVSPLTPLFLISIAGFAWAVGSFQRVRQFDSLESKAELSAFKRLDSREVESPAERLTHYLKCPSLSLQGSLLIRALAALAAVYLWGHLVHSIEDRFFYWLLVASFFFASLALWHGVLRFCLVWRQTHRLLRYFSLNGMGAACKRFRESFPALPKIDLASSSASLTHLECSVEEARTLWVWADRVANAEQLQPKIVGGTALSVTNVSAALQRLGAYEVDRHVQDASNYLRLAREADAAADWRAVITYQSASRTALSHVAAEVADVLQSSWWTERRAASEEGPDPTNANLGKVFRLAEEFLASRLAHFLAGIFRHMQNLIFTSVAGLLLLLFAVSSYPFQPHNVLLLFNWIIILTVVGIALAVFVQMSRDPILSYLNGTKPGQVSWDSEFAFRVFTYAVVPILALLGAQFPQSVGQILSHLMPGEGMHH